MQLPNIFTASKEQPLFILSIVLTETSTQTILLKLHGAHSTVVSKSKRYHYLDAKSLSVKTDEALQELGPDSEQINTVVFALEKSWIADGTVLTKKQELIDLLVKDLSLNPVGFIEQTEALAHAVAQQANSGGEILLLLSEAEITAILVQQGKVTGEQHIGKSGDTVADVTEALARLKQQYGTLPNKVQCLSLLLPDEELETAQQELLTADWLRSEFFLQQPSIEFMAEEAVLGIIAQQAGVAAHLTSQQAVSREKPQTTQQGDNFSPVDMALDSNPPTAKSFGIPMPVQETAEPDFGFVDEPELDGVLVSPAITKKSAHKPHAYIGIGVFSGLLALALITLAGLYFWSSVVIRLTPLSKTVSREVEVSIDASVKASDPEKLVIKAEQFEAEFSSTQSTDASGVAVVGERAKGSVAIFNKTQAEKTFAKGSNLHSGELSFTFDEDITVPAAKDTGNTLEYGKKSTQVTAAAIGAESNLAKDTSLIVESFANSSYAATVEGDFTGGASREVRVVSATDIELLLSDAKKDIREQAAKQFSEKSGSGQYILPPQQIEIVSNTADAKEGDETDAVSTVVVAKAKTLLYKTEDLLPIVHAVLQSEIPEGFVLKDKEPEVLSAANETADLSKKITLSVNISAQVVAVIDVDELRTKILGQSFESAKNILVSNAKIKDVSIELSPAVFSTLWQKVPKQEARVTVLVEGEGQ